MSERASLFEGAILGPEVVPGTVVPADTRLDGMGISLNPRVETSAFRPIGTKFNTLIVPGKDFTEGSVEGRATYTDIIYAFASIMGKTTPVTPATATNAREWTFTMRSRTPDDPQTYTAEAGSTVRAIRVPGLIFTEFGMSFSRDEITLSGAVLGQDAEDGIAGFDPEDAGITAVDLVPILPDAVDIFVDDVDTALGTTKLLRVLTAELSIGDRRNPVWVLNSANSSWAATVETAPTVTLALQLEADAAGMAFLPTVRQGDTKFIRVQAQGEEIEPDFNYLFQLDIAGKVSEVGNFEDSDGLYAITWTFTAVDDAAWGKAIEVLIRNNITAL